MAVIGFSSQKTNEDILNNAVTLKYIHGLNWL